jgi:cytoskeletal protein RodZ
MSEESNANGTPAGESVGAILRKARTDADIDVNKLCTDLRIAPQALEALEQGNYHLLPGDPYIRALLGSLARYLHLDPHGLVQTYNKEVGAVHAAPSIAPYKDRTSSHTASHKQIFIVIFAILIVVLIVLINQLKKTDSSASGIPPAPGTAAAPADSLAPQQDTLVSKSLAPDSGMSQSSPDSGETHGLGTIGSAVSRSRIDSSRTAKPNSTAAAPVSPAPAAAPASIPGPAAPAAPAPATPEAASQAGLNSAIVKPLIDSVGVRVVRSGKEDFSTLLRLGKQMQVSHTDTIVVMVSKRKSVEVNVGGRTVIPEKKRFKIYGTTVKTF